MRGLLIFFGFFPFTILFSQNLYVSTLGSDSNPGTSSQPLSSFKRAVEIAGISAIDTVFFDDGLHFFGETVILNSQHNGMVFTALPGATPIFTAGIKLENWTPYSGSIMTADLPNGIGAIRYLQDGHSDWLDRSATDFFSTQELAGGEDNGCIECNNYTLSTQSDMSNILVPVNFTVPQPEKISQYDLRATTLPWHLEILPIESWNPSNRRLYTQIPALYDLRKDPDELAPKSWLINAIEGIDEPGEWACIDGKIYLYPKNGTDEIYAPGLTELIRIDNGDIDGNVLVNPLVRDIVFEGITFTGGGFRTMRADDVTAQHDWMVVDEPDALMRIRNAENIRIEDCIFVKSGGAGLRIDRYAQNHQIIRNHFSYLGKGGIQIAGRGPGYGDVSSGNLVAYNYLSNMGMEKWASTAIMLSNSSLNQIHHNYITNTYFTGIAVVGPRQLMFAAHAEDAADFYVGREFHFWEMHPDIYDFMDANGGVLQGSQEAMRFVYNYGNQIYENAFIDVCTGKDIFINGQIYISGSQRSISPSDIKINKVERNYFYDSYNHSMNDYVIYSDSDQDGCDYIGNMIHGVQNGDAQPGALPIILAFNQWAETDEEGMGQISLLANLSEMVAYCDIEDCDYLLGYDFIDEGGVVNGVGGSAAYLETYQQMYAVLCNDNFPQVDELPGVQPVRNRLIALIERYGGSVPECGGCWNEICQNNQVTAFGTFEKLCGEVHAQQDLTLKGALKSQSQYRFSAGNSITLLPPFSTGTGSELTFSINACPLIRKEEKITVQEYNLQISNLVVYPNPVSTGEVTVEFFADNSLEDLYTLSVYSTNGSLIQQLEGSLQKGANSRTIDVHQWNDGLYFLTLFSQQGLRLTGKLLKN